jgi:hypothetical protein
MFHSDKRQMVYVVLGKNPISCIMDQLVCICLKGWILKADHCAEKYKAVLLSLFFVVVEKGSTSHVEIQLSYNTCVYPQNTPEAQFSGHLTQSSLTGEDRIFFGECMVPSCWCERKLHSLTAQEAAKQHRW